MSLDPEVVRGVQYMNREQAREAVRTCTECNRVLLAADLCNLHEGDYWTTYEHPAAPPTPPNRPRPWPPPALDLLRVTWRDRLDRTVRLHCPHKWRRRFFWDYDQGENRVRYMVRTCVCGAYQYAGEEVHVDG